MTRQGGGLGAGNEVEQVDAADTAVAVVEANLQTFGGSLDVVAEQVAVLLHQYPVGIRNSNFLAGRHLVGAADAVDLCMVTLGASEHPRLAIDGELRQLEGCLRAGIDAGRLNEVRLRGGVRVAQQVAVLIELGTRAKRIVGVADVTR